MSASFAHPSFMPCPECGASVEEATKTEHVCDPARRLDFEMFQLRDEVSGLDTQIDAYLSSARGRFEQWYADHERRRSNTGETDDDPAA